MNSQEIGICFEKASKELLKELFILWGYDNDLMYAKQQKSGTQHGFDLFMKLKKGTSNPVHIYIECKGSEKFTEINSRELLDKAKQLEWANYGLKDIHIFFSPTVGVDLRNTEITIEKNDAPFCIINWLSPSDFPNEVFELFFAYNGTDKDVIAYKKLLDNIVPGYTTTRSFEEIALVLRKKFESRVSEYFRFQPSYEFIYLQPLYWDYIQSKTDHKKLKEYYLRTDSSFNRLTEVIANNFCIIDVKQEHSIARIVKEAAANRSSLIKILSKGGEGKSTFLMYTGKQLCSEYPVFLIRNWQDSTIPNIQRMVSALDINKPVILLLDNAAATDNENSLKRYVGQLTGTFSNNVVLIIAEREFRYNSFAHVAAQFEDYFDAEKPYLYLLNSKINYEAIFEKLFGLLKADNPKLTELAYEESKKIFAGKDYRSVAERSYSVIKHLYEEHAIKYEFDWVDWQEKYVGGPLEFLYLIVAAFYQFGNMVNIEFCTTFQDLEGTTVNKIIDAIDSNTNQPIIRVGELLQLRHEQIAEWFIEKENKQKLVERLYKEWLSNINTPFSKNLLLWTYRNPDFTHCNYLKDIISEDQVLNLLLDYIKDNSGELSARTEAAKILFKKRDHNAAQKLLNEILTTDIKNLHARTELSKIYQFQKKWDEAEKYLKEYIDLDPQGLHPRTELSKIYQFQKKWDEAIETINELLEIDPENFRALTEKARIYKLWLKSLQPVDFKRIKLKKEYSRAVADSYLRKQDNKAIIMLLAEIFMNKRRYRVALAFLHKIDELNDDDLESVRMQRQLYGYMNHDQLLTELYLKGQQYIQKNKFIKYRERFEGQQVFIDHTKKLVNSDAQGCFIAKTSVKGTDGQTIEILPDASITQYLKEGQKVYYALYNISGKIVADCIEPYFSSLLDINLDGIRLHP